MLSIIIPSRVETYLQRTVDDLLLNARGEVEIIVILDGYWPSPMLKDDKRVIVLHQGTVHNSYGMREAINAGIAISKGEFIMKIDEHCLVDEGFDLKLAADCEEDWVVIPRRYRLDADNWKVIEDGRPPIDYMLVDFPYQRPHDKTCGLHGAEDRQRHYDRLDILIDDVMTMQGSCYYTRRSYWNKLFPNGMNGGSYGPFTQEAQEISMAAWLSGGRVVVNKKTFYAHFHKGSTGKGYGFSTEQYKKHAEWNEKGRLYCMEHWLNTQNYLHDFEWLIKKFWPLKGWKDTWKEDIIEGKKTDFSTLKYENDFWLSNLREEVLKKEEEDKTK